MSNRVLDAVWYGSEASGNDRLILLAIADEADDDGGQAFPSLRRLATKANIPKRTVQRCVERLEQLGELHVARPVKQGRGHFNRYAIPVDILRRKGDRVTPFGMGKGAEGCQDEQEKAHTPERSGTDPKTHRPKGATRRFLAGSGWVTDYEAEEGA